MRVLQVSFVIFRLRIICSICQKHEIACLKEAIEVYRDAVLCTKTDFSASCSHNCNITVIPDQICKRNKIGKAALIIRYDNVSLINISSTTQTEDFEVNCEFSLIGFCNVNNLDNSSSLDCATQQTSRPSTNPNSSLMAITTTSSITSLLESTSSDVTAEKKNNHDQARTIQDCTLNTGLIVGILFTGLLLGAGTTWLVSLFWKKRRKHSLVERTVPHPFNGLNDGQSSIIVTRETYNEIENKPESPRISYVLPITKDQANSSFATNDSEIYNHLREDNNTKTVRDNYEHAMPMTSQPETNTEYYGKLAVEENGSYSTLTNTNKTGCDQVKNEAYSTIESNEFQLEIENKSKDSGYHYFVLARE